jgi:hypothetical protein
MKNPMSNIVFGMAAATLSNRNIREVISNAPAPRRLRFPSTQAGGCSRQFRHKPSSNRHKNKTRNFLLPPACHCKAVLRILALQVPAVESGVLGPPAHRGWCLVSGTSTSMGGFPCIPCRGCGLGVSNRTNFAYWVLRPAAAKPKPGSGNQAARCRVADQRQQQHQQHQQHRLPPRHPLGRWLTTAEARDREMKPD